MTRLHTAPYFAQKASWPVEGRHIMAQYDDTSVVVYQAYRPDIGHYAARHGYFGGEFRFTRMSWVKPNFLWMMYRSGWGTKAGQEVTLAITLKREAFDEILSQAVHSSFVEPLYGDRATWQQRLKGSEVRLQWDPDHSPTGGKLSRRAIQLGLRGGVLARYAREWVLSIEDISSFVAEQRRHIDQPDQLITPAERPYPAPSPEAAAHLGLAPAPD